MFYDKFIELCERKGIKPSRVAIEAGFDKSSVSSWKKNWNDGKEVIPSTEILSKIANFFNVSTDYLLNKETQPESISDEDVMFALFGGKVSDKKFEEVKRFAAYIKDINDDE